MDLWLCRAISSRRLVPGDVVVVLPGRAICDMALLQGNCLVEESNLSGEVLAATDIPIEGQHRNGLATCAACIPLMLNAMRQAQVPSTAVSISGALVVW